MLKAIAAKVGAEVEEGAQMRALSEETQPEKTGSADRSARGEVRIVMKEESQPIPARIRIAV